MTDAEITYSPTLSLEENVKINFRSAHKEKELAHTLQTRFHAVALAKKFGIDEHQASDAALLHNIADLIPKENYIDWGKDYDLDIYEEEYQNPSLLNQRLSRIISVESFNITDKEVLNAINFHTTLRKNASNLDKIIFLADKISSDSPETSPYLPEVVKCLETSLDEAVRCYLKNFCEQQNPSVNLHPWLREACMAID